MKKGFTLIELLAVIVILAIITLIATPIILNIINDVKEESKKRSAENYLDAIEQEIVRKNMIQEFNPTECEIVDMGLRCEGYEEILEIEISGEMPTGGTIYFENGSIKKDSKLQFGQYIVILDEENKLVLEKETQETKYLNGKEIYFDVTNGIGCTKNDYHEDNSKTGYNGTNPTGNQTSCLKFYAFNDYESDKIKLLLDHNTTAKIDWLTNDDYKDFVGTIPENVLNDSMCFIQGLCVDNSSGPITLLKQLALDTSDWQGTEKLGIKDNIDYENYKARLITAYEIIQIIQNSPETDEILNSNPFIYFDTNAAYESNFCNNSNTSNCNYGWLYDRTNPFCTTYGCNANSDVDITGYWTSTYASSTASWTVAYSGLINGYGSGGGIILTRNATDSNNGIRPVIEVLKSKLK